MQPHESRAMPFAGSVGEVVSSRLLMRSGVAVLDGGSWAAIEVSVEDETETVCRVCGYDDEVFWEGGWPTAAICPCCGNESDVGDASVMTVRNYRGYWVGYGTRGTPSWRSGSRSSGAGT
ncbi:hypothetical protein [Streptomyces sudanensis]|uniref:hypothetical protein n=1 Tax=Streptomyces sudanensis TaxID=436397 RepID=UPI0020CDF5CA|nr:hypothetical protein [Streptomyces sudanensis]MCP9958341.1 hypothetical protein [Streptomyces sudanensis]MCQ0001142.1 hypothetical protein [Streptomyces sudanensis]